MENSRRHVDTATFAGFKAPTKAGVPVFVTVTHTKKRDAVRDYVLNHPYKTTTVRTVTTPAGMAVQPVTVDRPAPGTPPDGLYRHPTAPTDAQPYAYAVADADYPKPRTVHRPFFDALPARTIVAGTRTSFTVRATSLAGDALRYATGRLPAGAAFDAATRTFSWTPTAAQAGAHTVRFIAHDGVLPEHRDLVITVVR